MKKKVVAVNTMNYAGKTKRKKRADAGRTAHWKRPSSPSPLARRSTSPNSAFPLSPFLFMALKIHRPLTPASRFTALPTFDEITKSSPKSRCLSPARGPVAVTTTVA